MTSHRAPTRPRYGRIAALVGALLVTAVSMLGGIGVLPSAADPHPRVGQAFDAAAAIKPQTQQRSVPPVSDTSSSAPRAHGSKASGQVDARNGDETALPADSGTGRRIVFSETAQRVWLVDADGTVRRTYLVSGSLTDNLDPGSYEVYSKSRWAVGVDDSGVMQYYVRFAHGPRSTIGFHTIPTHLGKALQSVKDLGTPQSHGCIRQRTSDAIALWNFAPVGTHVVVV